MSELRTSPTNDSAAKKLSAPRSTKTSRAREIYLQKQALQGPSVSSATSSAPTVTKTVTTKLKTFKATPTPSYLGKKTPSKPNAVKHPTVSTNIKQLKVEPKTTSPEKIPEIPLVLTNQGDVADDDFEIVQLNEIKENNSPRFVSPRSVEEPMKIPHETPRVPITALKLPEEIKRTLLIEEPVKTQEVKVVQISQPVTQAPLAQTPLPQNITIEEPIKTIVEVETSKAPEVNTNSLGPPNTVMQNPCDAARQLHAPAIQELEAKLEEREKDIIKIEETLQLATEELKRLEEEYSIRLNDLTSKLNESEQKLEKCIEECTQHRFWVDNTEIQLSTMRLKFFESEQKLSEQEADLKTLLRWSNIKNASIVTCAAMALAYYHVKK